MAGAVIPKNTRRMPPDFPEVYVLLGCVGAELHFCTSWRAVYRWMREFGMVELVQLRRGYLRKLAASRGIPNAEGRKPWARSGGYTEMSARDPALEWMPIRRCRRPYRGEVWVNVNGGRPKPDAID